MSETEQERRDEIEYERHKELVDEMRAHASVILAQLRALVGIIGISVTHQLKDAESPELSLPVRLRGPWPRTICGLFSRWSTPIRTQEGRTLRIG